ncbi:MAG: monovalent cation/H(+) antiporter subunit G [Sphingomonadaceae bacterium]|nr:monovalent cation/H(+) antiporter subunit G [Sphingomonadaceae bacterium]
MAVAVFLGLAVAAAWLGAAAFVRLEGALAKVHAVAFVNVAAGAALTAASFADDGVSPRTLKVALIWAVTLATSALSSHVTARALHLRGGAK